MKKRISLIMFPHSGASVRQMHLSYKTLYFISAILMIGIGGVGYCLHDYYQIRHRIPKTEGLQATISTQRRQIHHQQRYIADISKDIGSLKNKIVALSRYEEKIRSIANLKGNETIEPFLGVGGPMPEDTDTSPQEDQ